VYYFTCAKVLFSDFLFASAAFDSVLVGCAAIPVFSVAVPLPFWGT
jgi:hypothetical protein